MQTLGTVLKFKNSIRSRHRGSKCIGIWIHVWVSVSLLPNCVIPFRETHICFLPPFLFVTFWFSSSRSALPYILSMSFMFPGQLLSCSSAWTSEPPPQLYLPPPIPLLSDMGSSAKKSLSGLQTVFPVYLSPPCLHWQKEKAFQSSLFTLPTPSPSYSPLITTCSNFLLLLISTDYVFVCVCLHPWQSLFLFLFALPCPCSKPPTCCTSIEVKQE